MTEQLEKTIKKLKRENRQLRFYNTEFRNHNNWQDSVIRNHKKKIDKIKEHIKDNPKTMSYVGIKQILDQK